MIDLHPKICNLCGGEVELIPNKLIYGKSYGSGLCYHCKSCGAYVGTHKVRPNEALGILADKPMREMKMKCHFLFDKRWEGRKHYTRNLCYQRLAQKMGIPHEECHFGWFNMEQLQQAYEILENWK